MLGDIEEWFYRGLGGIDLDLSRPESAERITIRPRLVHGLSWVRTSYESRMGRIESDWQQSAGSATITVTIPRGAQASVYVPMAASAAVTEGTVAAQNSPGVTLVRREAGDAIFRVNAGTFQFHFSLALAAR